VKENIQDFVVG
jgi:hypothetical protein